MSDRGDYRSWYAAIVDDPDFQALTPLAFKTLFVLKMTLGAAGIGIARRLVLQEQIGCTHEQLEAALVELETAKTDGARGWIVRERNVVWIVNGLKFEPTLSADNVKKHRPYVRRLIAPLGDRAIVREFIAYYAHWFGSCPMPGNGDRVSDTSAYPIDRVSEGNRYTATATATSDSDVLQATATATERSEKGESATAEQGADRTLARWLARFYGDAEEDRRAQVREQLAQLYRGEPVTLKRHPVKPKDVEHLTRKAAEMLDASFTIRDRNKAIVILLQKLQDLEEDAQGRVPSEALGAAAKAREKLEDEHESARKTAIAEWRTTHAGELTVIEQECRSAMTTAKTDIGYKAELTMRVNAVIVERIGFPDFERWRAQRRAS